jgi:hypothetical protein
VSWSFEPAGIATISQGGLLTGVTQGQTTLNAASANITGSTQVTVLLANVISIKVSPSNTSIASGGSVPYTAIATLADGTTQDISSTATWTVYQQGTTTQPSCIAVATGAPFTVTDSGGCTLPLTLSIQASYGNSNSGTNILSNVATLVVTS